MNQLKETLEAKRAKSRRERQVEKDEDGIVFDRDTDGQRATIGRACSRTAGAEEAIAETAS